MSQTDWKARPEGGGRKAIRLIAAIGRHGGRPIARALLYPITAYFLCMRAVERRASRDFLRRLHGRPQGWWATARHIHTFASTILDRVFLLSGRTGMFQMQTEGLDALEATLAKGRGVLVLGAHLGSFDALRVLGRQRPDLKIRVLLDKAHNPALSELFEELDPVLARHIIDAGQDGTAVVLAMKQAIDEGALVAMLADRSREGELAVPAPLLGQPAAFPAAPWLIASALEVPVMLAFGLYRGGNRYQLVFEPFADTVKIPRAQRQAVLSTLITRYAARLEHRLRTAPYNWFNFYDFWNVQARPRTPARAALDDRPAVDGGAAGQRQ